MLQPNTPSRSTTLSGAFLGAPASRLFVSRDLTETRAMVGRVMKPHDLTVASGGQRVEARMHHAVFGDVSVSRLCYGADVGIDPGPLADFFLVMMPLGGHSHVSCGGEEVESCQGLGSIASPNLPLTMRWSADNDQLMVRVARPFLERMLAAQRGQPVERPLEFRVGFEWRNSPAWQCVLKFLVDCAESGLDPAEHKLMLARAEEMVATTLLAEQPHNYRDEPLPRRTAVLPRHVRRVQEYLRAHAHEPVNAAQLAEVAGCSLRGLYGGFQDFCGMSPMQYLRELRLERVRSDLVSGCVSTGVSGIALRWGFTHLGRFSAEYKARFGEHPSETLRRR
ncbi:MAG TPA: AraC family transcriptional regulator [Burkholderiaceae bacterium]|nr:AraC family transcriptional regulator [Burkholderiaceae bacterium]